VFDKTKVFEEVEERIKGFLVYPDGWSFGKDGVQFSKSTVNLALEICEKLKSYDGVSIVDVSAGIDGEILLIIEIDKKPFQPRQSRRIDIYVENDDKITVAITDKELYGFITYDEDLDKTDAFEKIDKSIYKLTQTPTPKPQPEVNYPESVKMDNNTQYLEESHHWFKCENCYTSLRIYADKRGDAIEKANKCHWTSYIGEDGDYVWKCPECSDQIKDIISKKLQNKISTETILEKEHALEDISCFILSKNNRLDNKDKTFTEGTVNLAKDLCKLAVDCGTINMSVSAGLSGEILISVYFKHSITMEIFAESDNTITYAILGNSKYIEYGDKVSKDTIRQKISLLNLMYNENERTTPTNDPDTT
jgi:hypothetical protein